MQRQPPPHQRTRDRFVSITVCSRQTAQQSSPPAVFILWLFSTTSREQSSSIARTAAVPCRGVPRTSKDFPRPHTTAEGPQVSRGDCEPKYGHFSSVVASTCGCEYLRERNDTDSHHTQGRGIVGQVGSVKNEEWWYRLKPEAVARLQHLPPMNTTT